jgi:parvulin-like peptidyl-prolyl isomerase
MMNGWHGYINTLLRKSFFAFPVFFLLAPCAGAAKNFVHPRLIVVGDEKTAQEILAEVKSGKSFAILAKEKSVDVGSGDRYGDLGEIPVDRLDPSLRAIAGELKDGETSGVVALKGGGFALLQIVELGYYRRGAQAFRAGDYRAAESNLLKHIEANPDAVKGRIMLGKIYEARGDAKKAEQMYAETLTYDPVSEEAYSRLASLYMAARKYEKAAEAYKKGVKHLPNAEPLKRGLKNALGHIPAKTVSAPSTPTTASGRITPVDAIKAEKVFLRVILTRSDADARDILSQVKKGKSFALLAKARSIDEKSRDAFGYLGQVDIQTLDKPVQEALTHLKPGETSDVIPLDDKRFALVQKTDVHYFTEGEKAFISGDAETAEKDLLKHVQLNPDSVRALTMLGKIYEDKKDPDKAEAMYRQAISCDPTAVLVYERLGRMYLLAGQFAKAKELYQDGLTHVPSSEVLSEGLEMTDILMLNRGAGIP